jgi:hypothetical protein
MVRSSLDAGSANACVAITPGLGVVFQSRSPLRATTAVTRATGAYGPDGQTWTDIGSRQLVLGPGVLAGAAVTSASKDTLSTATLHDLQLMPIGAN